MTTFKEVQNLYWGCPIQTKDGIFPLIMYKDGEWLLDTPFYGFGAVEQDCKPILKDLADITEEDKDWYRKKKGYPVGDYDEWYAENITQDIGDPLIWSYLLSKHYDLFDLIKNGEAINEKTIHNEQKQD